KEPERFIVVGSNWQQSVVTIPYLQVPKNDDHLIISFHYYNQLFITHYGAWWTPMKDYKDKVEYPGVFSPSASFYETLDYKIVNQFKSDEGLWNKDYLLKQIQPCIDKGKELGLQVYCGEFGAYPYYIDKEPRLNWYKDVCAIFREHGIANAHWCYKADFPIVDDNGNPNEIPAILLNKNI
ncbi:MAG: cellulase family glycosylhydrolase, partial [Bacteroidales bacterium]|nr:cellulase family glycosylhydrolase [Bacteroidales bacterium]